MLTKEIQDLPVEKRLELASEIWESIRIEEQWDESVPQWQRELLEKRLRHSLEHPEDAKPWREVMDELERKMESRH